VKRPFVNQAMGSGEKCLQTPLLEFRHFSTAKRILNLSKLKVASDGDIFQGCQSIVVKGERNFLEELGTVQSALDNIVLRVPPPHFLDERDAFKSHVAVYL